MSDYMIRGEAGEGGIRFFAATTREAVEQGRTSHNTSPIATAALGRMLTASAMMGWMMKGEDNVLTLQMIGDGEMKGVTVTADVAGHVKGLVNNPSVVLPAKNGKLDVGGAISPGILRVIKDLGLGEPYVGVVPLQTGEIAEDLTYYFATSEQTPSSVGLGVLMNKENTVDVAGGFIVQLMPDAKDEVIDVLEENIKSISSVTDMLKEGLTPEGIAEKVLAGLNPQVMEKLEVSYTCDCSRERIEESLMALGKADMEELLSDEKPIEVRCHFCNKTYEFTNEDLRALMKE